VRHSAFCLALWGGLLTAPPLDAPKGKDARVRGSFHRSALLVVPLLFGRAIVADELDAGKLSELLQIEASARWPVVRLPTVDAPHASPTNPYAPRSLPAPEANFAVAADYRKTPDPRPGKLRQFLQTVSYDPEGAGVYFGATGAGGPFHFGAELGVFGSDDNLSSRISVMGLLSESGGDLFLGPGAGLRLSSPGIFPFAGVGAFGGYSLGDWDEARVELEDEVTGTHGSLTFSATDEEDLARGFAAVYPEIGAHLWITRSTRRTASASHYVTTEGRDFDFWMVGTYWTFLTSPL